MACLLVATVTVALVGYTPLGRYIPVSGMEMEHRYGDDMVDLQKRLNKLSEDVIVLREYNLKLRAALGEELPQGVSAENRPQAILDVPVEESKLAKSVEEKGVQVGPPETMARPVQIVQELAKFRASFPISVPVEGYITRGYDEDQRHAAIDYAAKEGTVVNAAADGFVVFAGWTYNDGNTLIVSHGGGYCTMYKHNKSLLVTVGEFTQRGQAVALLGNSGKTSHGPHLHFELWKDGRPQNPEDYILAAKSSTKK
ncbi:MAG: M23 family metallopeptidase [Ignavibacteriales bacterium]|nr:M23 family metallopeptidase [Ignavibacteriales bacterium]